jgi:phosphoribosylaminoimidazolecarboxamide formyltransferase/IMP cyclohydrolase
MGEERLQLEFQSGRKLRYGENDHQQAHFFPEPVGVESNVGSARQLHGKELSYNNLVDADAALEAVRDLQDRPAVAIIKHTNPCGFATGDRLEQAFEAAWQSDPVSAFGSVIAVSRRLDLATAQRLKGRFVEVLIAPGFDADALEFLCAKSKDLRILDISTLVAPTPRPVYKHILGGMLAQDRDVELSKRWDTATQAAFPEALSATAAFAWKACKHVKSNAIAIGYEYAPGCHQLIGMGPGQPNRIDSNEKLAQPRARETLARIAEEKQLDSKAFDTQTFINEALGKCVLASDAFFPFDDNVKAAHAGGIFYIVQPGGSVRDPEVVKTANELGMAMIFAGNRHFRH